MGARLAAALILSSGAGLGLLIALPLLAGALAPWIGAGVLLGVGVAGLASAWMTYLDYRYKVWHATLAAENERIALLLEARARMSSDTRWGIVVPYRQER